MAVAATVRTRPFYLDGTRDRLFAIRFEPAEAPRGSILYCPPFAEEMNKARRMMTLTARRLAAAGYAVLSVDLHGTGDSYGDFGEARWHTWRADTVLAMDWLVDKYGKSPISLWGLRLGAMLAVDAALARSSEVDTLFLWQPVLAGSTHMTQFLRLKIAAQMAGEGAGQGTREIRQILTEGTAVEIAGYRLAPEMFAAIDALDLRGQAPPPGVRIRWLDVVATAEAAAPLQSAKLAAAWRDAGADLLHDTAVGEPFWGTTEIGYAPALTDKTVDSLPG